MWHRLSDADPQPFSPPAATDTTQDYSTILQITLIWCLGCGERILIYNRNEQQFWNIITVISYLQQSKLEAIAF